MKLAIVGAGGMRTPLLIGSVVRRASRIGLDTIALTDASPERLSILGGLGIETGRRADANVRIQCCATAEEAVEGAAHVITTIRAGGERSRARDERIALELGMIGQETTGAAGFTMAARNLPPLIDICRLVERRAPGAWVSNFTNPSGLIAQRLRDEGFANTIGICDSPPAVVARIAAFLERPVTDLRAGVFGLNHLSWIGSVTADGEDILPRLFRNERFLPSVAPLFDPRHLRALGLVPVEYLFYYYHREKALEGMRREAGTRGERIESWNAELLAALNRLDPSHRFDHCFESAMWLFAAYVAQRNTTYMEYAREDTSVPAADKTTSIAEVLAREGEGYAGIALDVIEALVTGRAARIVLSVPSRGSIKGMRPDDVVETSCEIGAGDIRPVPVGQVPEEVYLLMRQVKLYERLACEAIRLKSRTIAARALMSHPLVGSYSLAWRFLECALAQPDPVFSSWGD